MIKSVSDNTFLDFCDRDVFGTRIKAYYNCYSSNYDFVNFWVQTDEDKIVSVISRIDSDITVTSTGENSDELKSFLQMIGFTSIQCEKRIADKMNFKASMSGYV
ncbi:MAG: hypothetical protein KBT46_04540, partial [Ruminococcus sp.]|nr:hypothetical protein [Candidatus Copronaster equi]